MSVREENTLCCETVEVGSQGLGMTFHTANPIVEIVYRNKENMGLFLTESQRTGEESNRYPSSQFSQNHGFEHFERKELVEGKRGR